MKTLIKAITVAAQGPEAPTTVIPNGWQALNAQFRYNTSEWLQNTTGWWDIVLVRQVADDEEPMP